MVICLGRGADLHMTQLMQLNMVLQPTRLVQETDQKKLQSDNVFIYCVVGPQCREVYYYLNCG